MSWTDVFPVFGEEYGVALESQANEAERVDLDALFTVAKVINP